MNKVFTPSLFNQSRTAFAVDSEPLSDRMYSGIPFVRNSSDNSLISALMIPALTVLFGLQVLRVLVPSLIWLLGDRFELGAIQLGAIVLIVFSLSFLAGGLRSLLSNRWSILITAGGLGLLRLTMQFHWEEPLVNLTMAMVGTVFFMLFLPIYLDRVRLRSNHSTGYFALGLLVGLTLDTALHGAFSTYDIAWQSDWRALLLTLILVLVQWLLLTSNKFTKDLENAEAGGNLGMKSLPWLAIGPFLFLQLVVFQNIARLTTLTGWPLPFAFGWTLLIHLETLVVTVLLLNKKRLALWPLALISGIALITSTAFPYPQEAWFAATMLLIGQTSLSLLIIVVLISISNRIPSFGVPNVTIANGLGMLLLLVFLIGYYAVYHINLPYNNTILEPIAASLVTGCALVSCWVIPQGIKMSRGIWLALGLLILLLVLPLVGVFTWQETKTTAGDGLPIRIMTYNLHNGFNTDGYLDMEALARVIEESNPDIVALQEVSRGWVINGRLDMLTWLSQRLNMSYVSGPTADPLWGNAILSHYPIIESSSYDLLPRDLSIRRGFISAVIDLGGGDCLQVIATHYHHLVKDSKIRQLQSPIIINHWNKADHTIVLGDLNADPDAPEIDILCQAGLVDALAEAEPSATYTFHSADLYRRIDYILVSPDLKARDFQVPFTNASDHLPVIAVIDR